MQVWWRRDNCRCGSWTLLGVKFVYKMFSASGGAEVSAGISEMCLSPSRRERAFFMFSKDAR